MKTVANSDQEKKNRVSRLPDRKYGYFRDDQIVLLVRHQEDEISGTDVAKYAETLIPAVKRDKEDAVVAPDPQVVSFQRVASERDSPEKMFSVLTYSVENAPEDPSYLLTTIADYNKMPKESAIVSASPNWIASIASQGAGTGGPGGRPSPYNGSRTGAPAGFQSLITSLRNKNIYGDGDGVDVVILDTAPSAHDLVAAPKEWPDHPILSKLLGPKGKLRLYPAPYDEAVRLGNTSLNDHDYNMTDHGLFIAGIIHSIVPKANIHLIEVLNQYGVGDLLSFVRGLKTVLEEIYTPERKLVVNCSWMLELPRTELHRRHANHQDPDGEFEARVLRLAQNDQGNILLLKSLFDQLYLRNRQAIAAAGNDGRESGARAPSRYPAALENVTGVGALPKTLRRNSNGEYEPSVYSNISDEPETKGIMTVGGEDGEWNGVLGVYIGEFPVEPNPSLWRRFLNWLITLLGGHVAGPRNLTKWAWWAGTSFATPIITGAVAAVLSSSNQIVTTQEAVQTLYDSEIIGDRATPGVLPSITSVGEDVMAVTQN